MKSSPMLFGLWAGLFVGLLLATEPTSALPGPEGRFAFEDADIHTLVTAVATLTGMTFLFDPAHVKGKITVLAPAEVSPPRALELLRSALALHGYILVARAEGIMWIVPARKVAGEGFVVRVVPLTYAKAGEVALTLSWVVPPGVRIVPFYPTNSVVISGDAAAVEQIVDIIGRRENSSSPRPRDPG